MINVQKAEYVSEYKLHLTFNNGRSGIANLEDTILNDKRIIFADLQDKNNFKAFTLVHGTVVWSDQLDLAPEYLFYLAFRNDKDLQEQFKNWGYITKANVEAVAA